MNYLLIVVLLVLAWSLFDGYKKGFMRGVFALLSWIIVLVLCNVATPIVTDFLIEETSIEESISETITEKLNVMIAESGVVEFEQAVPEELKVALLGEEGNMEEILAANGQMVINSSSIVYTIISAVALIIVIVVTRILMVVIDMVLGVASKLPIIGPADKLLGIVCGGAKGLIICWIVLAIITVMALTGTNTELASYITESQLLAWLQDNNFVLKIFTPGQ